MNPSTGPTMQDSVVGGDLHTGNVVHNHYHAPSPSPQPQVVHQPQPIIIQQVIAPQPVHFPIYVDYKKYHSKDWIAFGYAAILLNIISGGSCFGFNLCISLVGVVSLLPRLNLATKQPGHPEANKVGHAITINLVSMGVGLITILVFSAFMY